MEQIEEVGTYLHTTKYSRQVLSSKLVTGLFISETSETKFFQRRDLFSQIDLFDPENLN